MPQGWSMLNGWLGGWPGLAWHVLSLPFALLGGLLRAIGSAFSWIAGMVDSGFRVASLVQALLLPVSAAFAGCCVGRDDLKDASILWFAAAGLDALCAVLLGYPVVAGMVLVGSLAAFSAIVALQLSLRSLAGWLAAAMVVGLTAWGMERYGTSFKPVCWPLVPLSWCCLALGAAWGTRFEADGRVRRSEAARMLLLAMATATAAVGPSAVRAARAAAFLAGGTPPAPALFSPTAATPSPTGREAAETALPSRQPASSGTAHGRTPDAKPQVALPASRPRP